MTAKVHYSQGGEWGSTRVACNRYYTTDVSHTWDKSKVTCSHCLKRLKEVKTELNKL